MKPCHIDGFIFCLIAFFGAVATALSTDDAAKYIAPSTLWFAKNISTAISATFLALKMYRSTTYAKYREVEDVKMTRKAENQQAVETAATAAAVTTILDKPKPPTTT